MASVNDWETLSWRLVDDVRTNVWHLSLYVSIALLWAKNGNKNPVIISRKKLMKLSKIKSQATYHKCIRELIAFGYIDYFPTYNYYKGTQVYLKPQV